MTTTKSTGKDFTMEATYGPAYAWIVDGDSMQAVHYTIEAGKTIADWVRDYVKTSIEIWLDGVECRANKQTVYRVWRSGSEFDEIVEVVEEYYADFLADLTAS